MVFSFSICNTQKTIPSNHPTFITTLSVQTVSIPIYIKREKFVLVCWARGLEKEMKHGHRNRLSINYSSLFKVFIFWISWELDLVLLHFWSSLFFEFFFRFFHMIIFHLRLSFQRAKNHNLIQTLSKAISIYNFTAS